MSCGFYCRQDFLSRTQPLRQLGGFGAPGNRQDGTVVRSSRSLRVQLLADAMSASLVSLLLRLLDRLPTWLQLQAKRLAHASSVAPVVITSSTSKTRLLSTWLPGRVAKAPRTMRQRSSLLSMCLSGRALVRMSRTVFRGRSQPLRHFSSDQFRLVEAAFAFARSVERHRDDDVTGQAIAFCDRGDLLAEVGGQRIDPLKFQQDDRAYQRAAVGRVAPGTLEAVVALAQSRHVGASPSSAVGQSGRHQSWRSANRTNPRRQRWKRSETLFANRQPASSSEQPLAQSAPTREKHADERVACVPNPLHKHPSNATIYRYISVLEYIARRTPALPARVFCGDLPLASKK